MKLGFEARVLAHVNMGGVERYSSEILKIIKNDCSIDLVTYKPKSNNRYLQHIWEYTYLPYKAKKDKLNVLFCPTGAAPFNLTKNIKLAVTIHDIAFINYPDLYSKAFKNYYQMILPKVINRADMIFSVSDNEKNKIEEYYKNSRGKIVTVHEASASFFTNKKLKKEKMILAVASLNKNKNLTSLIKAFSMLLNKIPHKLVLVGGNRTIISTDNNIIKLIAKLPKDRILMTGYISDEELVNFYNRAELFVFPSFYEGFGIPPLEAMACGCPTLVSNISSLPEVCQNASEYVNPNDIDELAMKMYQILTDKSLTNRLIYNGYQRTSELTWENTARKILQYLRELL